MTFALYDHSLFTDFMLSRESNLFSALLLIILGLVAVRSGYGMRQEGWRSACWWRIAFSLVVFSFGAYFVYVSFDTGLSQAQIRVGFRLLFDIFLLARERA
jgi:hypothetical protein